MEEDIPSGLREDFIVRIRPISEVESHFNHAFVKPPNCQRIKTLQQLPMSLVSSGLPLSAHAPREIRFQSHARECGAAAAIVGLISSATAIESVRRYRGCGPPI